MTYILAIIIALLVLLTLNECYYWIVLYNTQEHHILRGRKKRNLDWIAFGSSYCRYGLTNDENGKGFNFGVAAQFLYYSDKMLREYAPLCLKKGGKIYLVIANLVFAEPGKGHYNPERYQEILSKESLGDEYDRITFIKRRFPLLLHPPLIKRLLSYIIKGDNNPFNSLDKNPLSEEQVLEQAKKRCSDWCRQFGLKDTVSSEITPELEKKFAASRNILTGMIQFCLDNGFEPILVVTPVSKIMQKQLSNEFLKKVLYNNIKLANKQGAIFLDYLRDEEFTDSSCYHNNADFLNAWARKAFTKKLIDKRYNENRNTDISFCSQLRCSPSSLCTTRIP